MTMKVRMQPEDIEVPEQDPFKNDMLGRKEPVLILTSVVQYIDGPCVLAVDGHWGAGKSTFIKIWSQYLRQENFHVVSFNAWETDFSEDPFVALSNELSEELDKYEESNPMEERIVSLINNLKGATREVVRQSIPGLVKMGTGMDITPFMEIIAKLSSSDTEKSSDEKLTRYQESRKALKNFQSALKDTAAALSESNEDRPLIIVINELDRCRPTYAANLLEVAKHFFAVDNIVFVLSINRSELAHSLCALYGSEFDSEGYLRVS